MSPMAWLHDRICAAARRIVQLWARLNLATFGFFPKGLYTRALIILIMPMVLLQSLIVFVFVEHQWLTISERLSSALSRDIAALVALYESENDQGIAARNFPRLQKIASEEMQIDLELLPEGALPPPGEKPFFSLRNPADAALSRELRLHLRRPYWLDTIGNSNLLDIRIRLDHAILRIIAHRSLAAITNTHVFIVWMVGTSLVLITIAIVFLRNQIRPILALAKVAQDFGKGRLVRRTFGRSLTGALNGTAGRERDFRPRGAREVRQVGYAFLEMKRRIERAIEQRTTMLNGVSHDLRTILTRFKLSLVFFEDNPEAEAMRADIDEMARMLEAYLSFARGDGGETAAPTNMCAMLEELRGNIERMGKPVSISIKGDMHLTLQTQAFKRCLDNLVSNALRHGNTVLIEASRDQRFFFVHIHDDGPGVPAHMREEVFRPFFRLDAARNQDEGNSGLGLAIARDIARSHGGDITLGESPALGGLRASVRIPV